MAKSNRESKKPKKEKVKIIAAATEPKGRDGRLATKLRIRQEKIAATRRK